MAKSNLPGNKAQKPPKAAGKPGRPKNVTYRCVSCGRESNKQDGVFLTSSSDLFSANNGHVPFCKTCLERYYMEKLLPALDGDQNRAIEMICAICDWYYSEDAVAMSKNAIESQGAGVLCSVYGGRRRLRQVQMRGDTYIDTILQRRYEKSKIMSLEDAAGEGSDPDDNHATVDPEIVHMFGFGYDPDEYAYLSEQYEDWFNRYDASTKAMEECMKALCVSQLNIRRAQQRGDAKGATDAMKAFQDLMNTAKLSPRQSKEDQIAQTDTFGSLIKKWEDNKPIPEPDEEFADVDGMRHLVRSIFMGHLARMFNIKNDWIDEYEEEIGKYTVTKPQYTADDEDSDQEISAIFGNAKHLDSEGGEE